MAIERWRVDIFRDVVRIRKERVDDDSITLVFDVVVRYIELDIDYDEHNDPVSVRIQKTNNGVIKLDAPILIDYHLEISCG